MVRRVGDVDVGDERGGQVHLGEPDQARDAMHLLPHRVGEEGALAPAVRHELVARVDRRVAGAGEHEEGDRVAEPDLHLLTPHLAAAQEGTRSKVEPPKTRRLVAELAGLQIDDDADGLEVLGHVRVRPLDREPPLVCGALHAVARSGRGCAIGPDDGDVVDVDAADRGT